MFNTLPTRIKQTTTKQQSLREKLKPIKQLSLDDYNDKKNILTCTSLISSSQNDVLNSLNYLKTIIDKDKYEIVLDSLQLLLESIIQLYNYSSLNQQLKFYINLNLAKLIRLFDDVICVYKYYRQQYTIYSDNKRDDFLIFNNKKLNSKILIENLIKFIQNLNNDCYYDEIYRNDFMLKRKMSDSNILDHHVHNDSDRDDGIDLRYNSQLQHDSSHFSINNSSIYFNEASDSVEKLKVRSTAVFEFQFSSLEIIA
jgi:hypothetical protein